MPEDHEEQYLTSSPDSYTGPVGKDLCDLYMETPLARREYDMDDNDAARALQELHNQYRVTPLQQQLPVAPRSGLKRGRPLSIDNSLQDDVREILGGRSNSQSSWSDSLVRSRQATECAPGQMQVPVGTTFEGSRKRVCCSTEANLSFSMSVLHPAIGGMGGPGMWEGILN